jgi:hypothetical protein
MSNLSALQAMSVLAGAVADLLTEVMNYDADLNDAAHDGADSRPPNGDDYNALLAMIGKLAARAGEVV